MTRKQGENMDGSEKTMKQECFVNTLSRLRESSKTAVVSADFSDPYTMYMHVNRPVQEKFVSVLKNTYNTNHSELILLCGSVGDGKSHMLSYCKQTYPEMMEPFYVHNDSTASLYIDKPASYTLMKIMDAFTDKNIETSNSKVILAINLGTLSNFLEADTENNFLLLKEYIDRAGILDDKQEKQDDDRYFHCVNFADYHLYELSSKGISSQYIKGIFNKIVQQKSDNIFYNKYCACCKECISKNICPIKINYELLSNEAVQNGIIRSLIKSIVKNKFIVSTRSLLNMIYEILVDERHFDRGSLEPRKEPQKLTSVAYCQSLLPNTLFGKRYSSEVLDAMRVVDPMQIRNEKIDDFIVFFENTEDIMQVILNDLGEFDFVLNRVEKEDFSDPSMHMVKEALLKLFVRMCWITKIRKDLLPDDEDYYEYMDALYAWNTGDVSKLKKIYAIVEKGILSWNGHVEKNEMQLSFGNSKSPYHLVQTVKIKKVIDNLPKENRDTLYSFKDELKLHYGYNTSEVAEIDVDYTLFSLLKRVLNGYVPSINDKRVNVKCMEFVNKISMGGSKQNELFIRDFSQKESKEYILEYDEAFGYTFEVS